MTDFCTAIHNGDGIVHVMNRVVHRCFLLGDDPISGKNFDHRNGWIEEELRLQSAHFGIDLLGFAILSNVPARVGLDTESRVRLAVEIFACYRRIRKVRKHDARRI